MLHQVQLFPVNVSYSHGISRGRLTSGMVVR